MFWFLVQHDKAEKNDIWLRNTFESYDVSSQLFLACENTDRADTSTVITYNNGGITLITAVSQLHKRTI